MAATTPDSFWNPAAYALSERLIGRLRGLRADAQRLDGTDAVADSEWAPRDEALYLLDKSFADLVGIVRTRAGEMTGDRRRECERWLRESPFGDRRDFAAWLRATASAEPLALFIELSDYLRLTMLDALAATGPTSVERKSA